jgi:hypothetical protein
MGFYRVNYTIFAAGYVGFRGSEWFAGSAFQAYTVKHIRISLLTHWNFPHKILIFVNL